jgi:FAD/FMN-containing dehydrogenase
MNYSLKLAVSPQSSVITPESSEYEVARKVYNEMIDRRPDFIVRCADVADVDRLLAIKRKYDPDNFFHANHNIRPD